MIADVHEAIRGTYGAPRIHKELTEGMGLACSKNRVARLMRLAGIIGVHQRRLRRISWRDENQEPSPDRAL